MKKKWKIYVIIIKNKLFKILLMIYIKIQRIMRINQKRLRLLIEIFISEEIYCINNP